ncbi:MAG: efflux RND transporter periplasmic adaptor subunit [Planctomycetia bacterium]|nr:efflux RND transporter periplasmic adaptor subunit [Planctomycetia bacterium]
MASPSQHAAVPQVAGHATGHGRARSSWLTSLRRGLSGIVFLAAGGLAWWWLTTHHFTQTDHAEDVTGPAHAADGSSPAETSFPIVKLPAATAASGDLEIASVERRALREHLTVPGRLDYDARSRLDYDSPVGGIVSRMFVVVRQRVAKGDSLAEVSSPEVGIARDEVQRREADREIAKNAADWAATIANNVQSLIAALESHPPLETVEQQFKGRRLGTYREQILGTYSRLLYVEKVNAGTRQLSEGGVLSGRIIEERTSNLEVARASFAAACEETQFDIVQQRDKAKAALEQAERLVQVSKENLRNLVGGKLEADSADATPSTEDGSGGNSLSAISLRTPFAGIVEEVFVSRGQRVQAGDKMFVVADTSTLWVRAQVHEKQWTTVEITEGQEVRVVVPGAAEHRTVAMISHVGATVDADSRSVPIVAALRNDDAHYKPGMFVWVELPQGEARDGLAVPAAAVMRHEGKAFVFTPAGTDGFRRIDVETGIETDDFVEVKRGLEAGQKVVAKGAFLLKSELLLEDEG